MAENGNRGPNDAFRRQQSGRKRREPPIIDAAATEVPAAAIGEHVGADDPVSDGPRSSSRHQDVPDQAPGHAAHTEPVLFGTAARETSASAEALPEAASDGEAGGSGYAAVFEPSPEVGPALSDDPERGGADDVKATASDSVEAGAPVTPPPPRGRAGWSPVSILLTIVVVALLASIAGLLLTEQRRNHSAELSASLAALQGRVQTLEARPDSSKAEADIAAIDKQTSDIGQELASLKQSQADLAARLDAVSADVAAASAKSAQPEPAPASNQQPSPHAASADAETLSAKVDDLSRRLAALQDNAQPAPAAQPTPPPVDLGPVESRVAALGGRLSDLDRRVEAVRNSVAALPKVDLGPVETALTDVEHRLAPLEAALATPKAGNQVTEARAVGSADETRAAPLAVVAESLNQALAAGRPIGPELDALRALGVEDASLAPLTTFAAKGAPTIDALKEQWAGLERTVVDASRPSPTGGVLDRLAAGARGLVEVRRVGAAPGEDPGSAAGRVGAALDGGDVAGALEEWAKLPEAGQHASEDWADAAHTLLDAQASVQTLLRRAIMTLGKAKG